MVLKMEKLTFEEYKSTYYRTDFNPDVIAQFEESLELDLNEEVDKIIKKEYELYLEDKLKLKPLLSKNDEKLLAVLLEHQSRINQTPEINNLLKALTKHFAQFTIIKDIMQIQPIHSNPGLINCIGTNCDENNKLESISVQQRTVHAGQYESGVFTSEFLSDLSQGLIEPSDFTDHLLLEMYRILENELLNKIIQKATKVEIKNTNNLVVFYEIINETYNIATRSKRADGNVIVMSEKTITLLDKLDPDKKMLSIVDNIGYINKTIKICIHEGVGDKILLAYNSLPQTLALGDGGAYFVPYKLFDLSDLHTNGKKLICTYGTHYYNPENYYTAIELI